MAVKFSRRLVTEKIVDMLELGTGAKRAAQVLAAYLLDSRQTRQAELYLRDIRRVLVERQGLMSVEVAAARQLTDKLASDIKEFIKQQTAAETVEIIDTVQPDLISGVVISTTDSVYDGSLKNKIKKLKAI
ncbi:MAG: F0F1 ATP synthase subunit delta [Candidatus Nomurabacteria bacterium]|jgi:F0F1-type ATP synthase delta subunit|nr:F0F1 ATP synthase subunit delta [Candidatus Nomurabacteria bacterium]